MMNLRLDCERFLRDATDVKNSAIARRRTQVRPRNRPISKFIAYSPTTRPAANGCSSPIERRRQSPDRRLVADPAGKRTLAIVTNERYGRRAGIEYGGRLAGTLRVQAPNVIHQQARQSCR
jgi:hypothetical protein